MSDATLSEIMTITAARALDDSDVCFVGIGLPSEACNVARLTHAPNITLIYESGTIGTKPNVLPLSIGDGELCETAISTVSVPEMFRYWLQGGSVWQTENCCNNRCQCIGLQLSATGVAPLMPSSNSVLTAPGQSAVTRTPSSQPSNLAAWVIATRACLLMVYPNRIAEAIGEAASDKVLITEFDAIDPATAKSWVDGTVQKNWPH